MHIEEALDYRNNYEKRVFSSAANLRERFNGFKPELAIVLGSGLGDLAKAIESYGQGTYDTIPFFPQTTVAGHEGKVIWGSLEGVPVVGFQGRKHFYEAADDPLNTGILQAVFPVHVLAELGVPNYFATNAAGGLNENYKVGDVMVLRSHINFLPNPLLGRHMNFKRVDNGERVERFQPMNGAYDEKLRLLLLEAGRPHLGHIHQGTYLAVTGPTYETEGESIAFRDGFKADAVGMSTTAEVIVARNRGMKAIGLSCITNVISEDGTNATNHEEVKRILESKEVRDRLTSTVTQFFKLYKASTIAL